MMSDLSMDVVDAHDAVVSEGHPVSGHKHGHVPCHHTYTHHLKTEGFNQLFIDELGA
jgi:hypothetical protein